jgi:hypothetical protein
MPREVHAFKGIQLLSVRFSLQNRYSSCNSSGTSFVKSVHSASLKRDSKKNFPLSLKILNRIPRCGLSVTASHTAIRVSRESQNQSFSETLLVLLIDPEKPINGIGATL